MKDRLVSRIKRKLTSQELSPDAQTGALSDDEHATAYALLEVLADDETYPAERCRSHVDFRCGEMPGYFGEYRRGLAMLERSASERHGRRFTELALAERDALLRGLLRRYPHPASESIWRRRLKFTSENLDMLLGWREDRRFRRFVVRDLLEHYFTSERGWGLVGYREFPGYARQEREPCQVIGLREQGDRLVLELSDATFEKLDPCALEADEKHVLAVRTKSGRQRATFSPSAYHEFCQYLEDGDDGVELVVANRRDPVPVAIGD